MPRGGKRNGAGRPKSLTFNQRILVGVFFEQRWAQLKIVAPTDAELKRREEIDKLQAQYRDAETRFKYQPQLKDARQASISRKIDHLGRVGFIVKRQPRNKGASAIIATIEHCRDELGITITPRRVIECRTLVRRLTARKPNL